MTTVLYAKRFKKTLRKTPAAPTVPVLEAPPAARRGQYLVGLGEGETPSRGARRNPRKGECEEIAWPEAVADFVRQMHGGSEENTQAYYKCQLSGIARWAGAEGLRVMDFRVRHLRDYIAHRAEAGLSERTRRHDAVAARAFCRFCAREGYMPSDPLEGYAIPKAERGYRKSPSEAEVRAVLAGARDKWLPAKNPGVAHVPQKSRTFLQRRNYAIIAAAVDTGCRIGEILGLHLTDYDAAQRCIHIRKSKGNRPRTLPVSAQWQRAVEDWLRVRPKCDSLFLFISRFGDQIDVSQYGDQFQGCRVFARAQYEAECKAKGVPADDAFLSHFTLHGLRHYAATALTDRAGYEVARKMLGHSSVQTTENYVHSSAETLRAGHDAAGPLARLLVDVRSEKARRRRLV